MQRLTCCCAVLLVASLGFCAREISADGPGEWKVIAMVASVDGKPKIPIGFDRNQQKQTGPGLAFRGPNELAKKIVLWEKGEKVEVDGKKASELAAGLLKVDRIDWDNQMVLAIDGGRSQLPRTVQLVSLRNDGKVLTVTFVVPYIKGENPLQYVRAFVLIPRFEGEVRFVRENPK